MQRRPLLHSMATAIATLAVAGCLSDDEAPSPTTSTRTPTSTPTPAPYPSPARDPTPTPHSGDLVTEPTPLDEAPLTPRWEVTLPGQYELSTPGIDGTRVYIGTRRELFAIDRSSGAIHWDVDLGAMTRAFSAAVTDTIIVAAARNVMDHGLLREGVDDLWEDPHPYDTPTDGGHLHAIKPASGNRVWSIEAPVSGSPVVEDGRIFVPYVIDDSMETGVTAFSLASGEELWSVELDVPPIFSNPVLDDRIYVASSGDTDGDSHLAAITRDGDVVDTGALTGTVWNDFTVHDNHLYVGTDAGYLYAIADEGYLTWRKDLGNACYTTPAIGDGTIYASATDRLLALDMSGEILWRGRYTHDARSGISVSEGLVHVGGLEISAFAEDGSAAPWRIDLPGSAGSFGAPIYEDGVLYTGACIKREIDDWYDHVMYALE